MKTCGFFKTFLNFSFFRQYYCFFTLILPCLLSCYPAEGGLARPIASNDVSPSKTCGGLYRKTLGFISSPNFPHVFANPEKVCHWIIQGGQRQQISLFIAELYTKPPVGIAVTAHDTLPSWLNQDADRHAAGYRKNGSSLGFFTFNSTPDVPIIRTTKTFMVVSSFPREEEEEISNQVPHFSSFLHFRGFNLTYTISPQTVSHQNIETSEENGMCSFRTCRFLGRCLIDADLSNSRCHCLPGHFGDRCQFGPSCDPSASPPINPCVNATNCEYSKPNFVVCNCPPHLTGDLCDTWRTGDSKSISVREAVATPVAPPTAPPCRFYFREPMGLIKTPNFPVPFHTPIDCEWVLNVGQQRNVIIYFTEIYLAYPAFFRMAAYDQYENGRGTGEIRLNSTQEDYQFDFDRYADGLVVKKPFVVIRMQLNSSHSMVRVRNFVLNDFGFNLTYVTYPKSNIPVTPWRGCTGPFACRFAGRCLVNHDYTNASCVCYDGQFGDACEFGPKCNPLKNPPETPCLNQGVCSYKFGTDSVQCQCPAGFGGPRCEQIILRTPVFGCENLFCQQRCVRAEANGRMKCACHPGFKIDPKNSSLCLDAGRKTIKIDFSVKQKTNLTEISQFVLKKLRNFSSKIEFCREKKEENLSVFCLADDVIVKLIEGEAKHRQIFNDRNIFNVTVESFPVLDLLNLTFFTPNPALEKSEIALVCLAQGSPDLKFSWFKDGVAFFPSRNPGMWLTEMALGAGLKSCQVNIENVKRPHQGVFTCLVEDQDEIATQSISLDVLRSPNIIVLPSTPTIHKGQPLAITCMSSQSATYRWLRRTEDVKHIPFHHTVNVLPAVKGGLQLFIDHVDENTEYTCTAKNEADKSERVIKVRVLLANDPVCQVENHRGILWGLSLADTDNEQLCPFNMSGTARRRCSKNAQWLEPDFSDCISLQILAIKTVVDGMQVGFGNRDLLVFKKSATDVNAFVVSQRPLFSRDLSTAVALLDVLSSMALEADFQDSSLNKSLSTTLELLLSEMDVLPTDILGRFSLPHIEKTILDELQRRTYRIYGKFPCHVTARNEILINETILPRYHLHCPVISHATSPGAPDWTGNLSLSLQMDEWSSSTGLLVPELTATVIETAEEKSEDSLNRIAPILVDLELHKPDSVESGYMTHLVFDLNVSGLMASELHKLFSEPSVIRETVACVYRTASSEKWSTKDCRTEINATVNFSPAAPVVLAVHCLCRLSNGRVIYGIRINDNSTSNLDPLRIFPNSPSYVVPVIIIAMIVVLLLVCIGLFCWQRKKISSCVLRFKKRTCDFVTQNFRTSQAGETAEANEIPMSVSGKRLADGTGTPHPEEVASLVPPQGTVTSE